MTTTFRSAHRFIVALVALGVLMTLAPKRASALFAWTPVDFYRGNNYADWKETDPNGAAFTRFGAGYNLGGYVRGYTAKQEFEATGHASADVMLFGEFIPLVFVKGTARATPSEAYVDASLSIGGREVGHLRESSLSVTPSVSQEFAKAQMTFVTPIFVPVTLKISATGEMGLDIQGSATTNALNLTTRPFFGVWGSLSAGVDAIIASAWVSGTVQLVEVSVPVTTSLSLNDTHSLNYSVLVDIALDTLSGYLSLDLYSIFGNLQFKFFEWSGLHWAWNLYAQSGTASY